MQPNNQDLFQEFSRENKDVANTMNAMYMLRRFRSMGILAEYIMKDGQFSHFHIPANDDMYLELSLNPINTDGSKEHESLMSWIEYEEPILSYMKDSEKITGYYCYTARFKLVVNDFDPEFPDRETLADEHGPAEIASFRFTAGDFQQFFYGALYFIKDNTGFEVYPSMRKSRVAL